jgi:hypothetical protein
MHERHENRTRREPGEFRATVTALRFSVAGIPPLKEATMAGPDDKAGNTPVQNFQPAQRHVGVGPDSDGDGLSDDFETRVFGSDPAKAHSDNDGLNDYVEYWLDTDPKNDDTDGDGWLDGEDLAFGDPLRWNDGGKERTELRERARRQFDAEGSDKDGDWLRDHVEAGEGTKKDQLDSDNDGLSDGVEVQLRNAGVETHQDSTPDDTTDLDAAREQLGERRWESDRLPGSSSNDSSSIDGASYDSVAVADPLTSDVDAGTSYDAAALAADIAPIEAPTYDDTSNAGSSYAADELVADVAASADGFSDDGADSWA